MGIKLLLTGRPDALIAELIDELVKTRSVDRIWFVIAPEDVEVAITHLPHLPPLQLIIGDFSMHSLGMKSPIEIWESATHLVHLYEHRAFDGKFARFFSANIEALRNTLAFALKMKSLRQAIFLSTIFVAGRGEGTFPEAIREHDNEFRNHYERTKFFAEIEIHKKMHLLPVTIMRLPFVIFCHETSEWVSYARHIRNYVRFSSPLVGPRYIGEGKGSLNFIDFDTLREAFNRIFDNPDSVGRVYNLVGEPVTSDSVLDVFASAYGRRITGRMSLRVAKAIASLSGSFFGIPPGMIDYFDAGPDYEHENMVELGIEPPDSSTILSKLHALASRICREGGEG